MTLVNTGCSRIVFLVGRLAFKFPRYASWRTLLLGLLADMQEARVGKANFPGHCPVLFSLPGGWLVVMPRCEPLRHDIDFEAFCERGSYIISAEPKRDSFGIYKGEVVALDYAAFGA